MTLSTVQTLTPSSALVELGVAIETMKNHGWLVQLINSKDNASSLDKSWKKLDGIIYDAVVCISSFFGIVSVTCYSCS